jgi:hypothetical protein
MAFLVFMLIMWLDKLQSISSIVRRRIALNQLPPRSYRCSMDIAFSSAGSGEYRYPKI